jgi:hypothetical protein
MSVSSSRSVRGLFALLVLSVTFSIGRGEESPPDTPPDDTPPADLPRHDPFTLYDADEGALEWSEMSPADRAITGDVREWAETRNGEAVHNAFSTAAATTSTLRLVAEAQRDSGLEGVETLGVVP